MGVGQDLSGLHDRHRADVALGIPLKPGVTWRLHDPGTHALADPEALRRIDRPD